MSITWLGSLKSGQALEVTQLFWLLALNSRFGANLYGNQIGGHPLFIGSRRHWEGSSSTCDRIPFSLLRHRDMKRLKGVAECQLRIGDWHVIFIEDARSITVVAVGNRKEIYD